MGWKGGNKGGGKEQIVPEANLRRPCRLNLIFSFLVGNGFFPIGNIELEIFFFLEKLDCEIKLIKIGFEF